MVVVLAAFHLGPGVVASHPFNHDPTLPHASACFGTAMGQPGWSAGRQILPLCVKTLTQLHLLTLCCYIH